MKRTKIVCTLGPATETKTIIKKIIKNGMNVARLNLSHNVHSYHLNVMKTVRAASKELKTPVAILLDLQGPRIRLGDLPDEGIKIKKNQKITLTTDAPAVREHRGGNKKIGKNKIGVTYAQMHKDVSAGQKILIADGLMELKINSVKGNNINCVVVTGGTLKSHKGINLPDTDVSASALSEKDKKDLLFGIKNKVDFVALSFVRTAQEVRDLKNLIRKYEKQLKIKSEYPIKIIVKIERKEAVDNFDEILEETNGVMVARGDLGIELPAEDVPLIQKMIIDKCLHASKPVIVATQMLESMIENPRPTRAEVSDVANAVIDHTDAVMLSGETAAGKYPVEAVSYMARVVESTENSTYDDLVLPKKLTEFHSNDDNEAISQTAKVLSEQLKAKAILGATMSGHTARVISRYRPEMPIYMGCIDERVLRQLCLSWGVKSFKLSACKSFREIVTKSIKMLKKSKFVKKGDQLIVIGGIPRKNKAKTNIVELHEV